MLESNSSVGFGKVATKLPDTFSVSPELLE